jgi:monoamine oxidase
MRGRTPLFRRVMQVLERSSPALTTSRRHFMRTSVAAGAGALLSSCANASRRDKSQPVAIVGAGVAGLTAAYRLGKTGQTVHLYEASERVGGRMFTRRQFNADGQFVELGGELVDTDHKDLIHLAKELGLKLQNLVKGDSGHELFWFDGEAKSEEALLAAFRPLGDRIAADADGLYDAKDNFTDKARQLDQLSLADYLRDRGQGVAPWVIELIVAAYEPEYGVEVARQSSLNLIDFIDPDTSKGFRVFGDSDEAWRIAGGNGSLPEALYAALSKMPHVRLQTSHRLSEIADAAPLVQLSFATEKGPSRVSYEQVVLAMPFTVLRNVKGVFDLPLSDLKKRSIREMGYGNNVKVFRSFSQRLWRQQKPDGHHACNGSVFSQQSTFQNVWETSRGQSGERGILTNLLGGQRAAGYSEATMNGYLNELEAIFPAIKASFDGKAGSMNWPKVPWALGSYSAPLVGQYTWVYEASPTPELGGRLLFAGEHTSLASPGFMNGGVESGNRAAREVLGKI